MPDASEKAPRFEVHPARRDRALERLERLEIELPSWGFADTGTRFGKFLQDAAAISTEDKLDDAAEVHRLTGACPAVAIHVLWDVDGCGSGAVIEGARSLAAAAKTRGLRIGAINPNVFQDQCYRGGSLANEDPSIRRRAIDHLIESIAIAKEVGSDALSLWFADGANYPGQACVRRRKRRFEEGLREVHEAMPASMTMLLEYKPFEPAFYFTDLADWGMACTLARKAGPRAKVLVDTGHHLLGQNVEQIVAFLLDEGMLGGFHFNDRHYADDDLTSGSIDPYRAFRIFLEIVRFERDAAKAGEPAPPVAFMIDQSHNLKPKVEAMVQTVCTVQELSMKALLVDLDSLDLAQSRGDIVAAEECLKDAFATDVRPVLAAWRAARGLPGDPLEACRANGYAAAAAAARRPRKQSGGGSYA